VVAPAEPITEEAPAAPAAEPAPDSGAADADVPAESAPAAEVREKIFVIQPGKRRAAPVHRDEPEGYPGEPEGEKKIPLEQVMSETVEAVLEEDDGILESAEPLGKRVGAAFSGAVAGLQGHMAHRREARQSRPEPKRRTPEPLPPEPDMEDAFREEKRRCKKLHRAALSLAVPTALLILQAVLTSLGAIPAAWAADPLIGLGVPCALLAAAMILAAPVWKQALQSLREHQVGCELAAGVNALVVLADCVYGILTGESIHPPFTAASALLMWTCLYGLRKAADSRREAFYLANLGGRPPYAVAVTAAGACKQSGRLEGFYHLTSREDPARRWQMLLVPLLLALATVLAAVVCLGDHRMEDFLWVWSALLTASVPLSLPLTGTLPLAWLNQRLNRSGSAVAGYHGAYLVSRAKRIVVTDDDIFPPGTVGLNGLKVYGEEIGKVVSYAATLARDSGSQLSPLFEQLLTGEGGFHVDLQDLHFYEEGGVGGTVDGESVIMGSAYFMKKSHVDLPRDLKLKTGVFLAVDGRLIAVFAIKYQPSRNVEWALRAIRRNRIQPVLAVRGGNITPGLLRSKFNLDVKPVYPDVSTRLALSDLCAEPVERPGAIIYREGLMPFAETVIGGQRLVSVVRWATVLTYVGALAGLLLSYYLTHVGGFDSLSPLRMLAFLGLWLVPTVLLSGTVKHY
jgi:hypothetical protein